ncbi:sensor histidine kinase RegB [Halocynthiibacter styelae]|uniref:histidine kinase n=1 Tax=Halocynthiibacter styelae TaxID=2761955 RepID=A0A8J7IRA9_9RHOB|nr:ActS/PrrB/RegB family redox-sensitive histidine kinase [Paenihalocynthiibacter styelae]MBI1494016.1 ActS/PrrB/RegB family redox-sensitive histidine kinase [Paenihalocynthiibacter styelae]
MTDTQPALFGSHTHNNWIRLRTLIMLRWLAIAGQVAAVIAAAWFYQIQLKIGYISIVIGVSVIVNLVSMSVYPNVRRLTESQAARMLLFDTVQLTMLLWLTGGLNNPFAFLIVAPVTISAAALSLRSTIALAGIAASGVTLLALTHLSLVTADGTVLAIPAVLAFGFWAGIITGILFLGLYAHRVTSEQHSMSEALLATQMALSREQKLTDLGGVIAAAAHELGTPLATIKLVSSELVEELEDQPDLRDDAILIREQVGRCHDIMRSMGRAGKSDKHLQVAALQTVIEEAAEPHVSRGKEVHFDFEGDRKTLLQPEARRMPEFIHGLRNLIQNAVDFAQGNVWVEARWNNDKVLIRVIDDGPGFPLDMAGRIGDPFVRRRSSRKRRPEYQGMGLGLFIAKTLLERTGAELSFNNGADPYLLRNELPEKCGAIVEVTWPSGAELFSQNASRDALGENDQIT